MVSFTRMKEDFDDISTQVEAKLPGKTVLWLFVAICILIIFVLGFGIGFGSAGRSDPNSKAQPIYYFISNNSESCPMLSGEKLLTTVAEGQSFEGLTVHLQCQGNYNPYPLSVKCQRKKIFDGSTVLEWSNLPVCHPAILVTPEHWTKVPHARSVSCSGTPGATECKLHCIQNYAAVEESMYKCDMMPCRAWTPEGKKCYICSSNCDDFGEIHNPAPSDLLETLTCDPDCDKMTVTSEGLAAVWQNKRTGLFEFVGEHNGRPAYQNNATKEYLYYTFTGAEWLVGPDFRKPHAGIQVFQNKDKKCPERHGGENTTSLYIDSSEPTPGGGGMWKNDTSIKFQCYKKNYTPVQKCSCTKYKVYHTVYHNDTVPKQVEYLSGVFVKEENLDNTFGLLAPLYVDNEKDLMLFSHHPEGRVWQISQKLTTTPLRGVFSGPACPDSEQITWEWYNITTPLGQQLYVKDPHVHVKCISHSIGT